MAPAVSGISQLHGSVETQDVGGLGAEMPPLRVCDAVVSTDGTERAAGRQGCIQESCRKRHTMAKEGI